MKKKTVIFNLTLIMIFALTACSTQTEHSATLPVAEAESSLTESTIPAASASASLTGAADSEENGDALETDSDLSKKMYGVSVMKDNNQLFLLESDAIIEIAEVDGDGYISYEPADSITEQTQQIDEMIGEGIDVLIIDPVDRMDIEPALFECERAGVPVIILNSQVSNMDLVTCYITSDYIDAGRQAGRSLCDAIGGEGEIAIIGWLAMPNEQDIISGLKEIIKNEYPNVTIIADRDANGTLEDAQDITDDLLQTYPDLKGIFAVNEYAAQGIAAALHDAEAPGKIFVSSASGSQNSVDMVKEGELVSAIIQQPTLIGATAVDTAKEIWTDEMPAKEIIIPVINVVKENLEECNGKTY